MRLRHRTHDRQTQPDATAVAAIVAVAALEGLDELRHLVRVQLWAGVGHGQHRIRAARTDGRTLAAFAAEHGVSEDELVDAILADAEANAAAADAEGDLTQAEADELLAGLEERARAIVNDEGFGVGPFGGIFGPGMCDDTNDDGAPEGESTSDQI